MQQDTAIELGIAQGGYGRKQLYELVQNGADALLGSSGRIDVTLSERCLYVANEGLPISDEGVNALMASHLSQKRGEEIGRFGLGFKSVVAISDAPQVFSRSGSFGFDRAFARDTISAVVGDAPSYPMMRVARALDPRTESEADPVLADLMTWATTVIKVPLLGPRDHLLGDLATFPGAFLLFSPQVEELHLRDTVSGGSREIRVALQDDDSFRLSDTEGTSSSWRVARKLHRPSPEALEDAGELAHRESIAIAWAAPLDDRSALGTLWAFFPTQDRTTLSGIVNAPWKLSDDRRNLLPGAFNEEILTKVLPELVAGEWTNLYDSDRPARVLDYLPARGKEDRSWADKVLNEPIYARLRSFPCVPDVDGELRRPQDLRLHPREVPHAALETWGSKRPCPSGWVHHSVDESTESRSKVERLLRVDASEISLATPAEWLKALLSPPSVEGSSLAIRIVELMGESVADAKVVLLEDGTLSKARSGHVFVRSSTKDSGFQFIHPELALDQSVLDSLRRLGISLLDKAGELRHALTSQPVDWSRIWKLARQCNIETARSIFVDELPNSPEQDVRVRNRQGRFVGLNLALLPGGVIGPGSRGDEKFAIDVDYHHDDIELLTELGAVAQPVLRSSAPPEAWLGAGKEQMIDAYLKELSTRPQREKLVVDGPKPPWPLDALSGLTPPARAVMTSAALALTSGQPWTVSHTTNRSYPTQRYRDPVFWWVRKHGCFETGVGSFPASLCVRAGENVPADVFPSVDVDDRTAHYLELASDLDDLSSKTWDALLELCHRWEPERRHMLYAWGAWKIEPPSRLLAAHGSAYKELPTDQVAVVASLEDYRSLIDQRTPVILMKDQLDVEQLIEAWGLENGKTLLEQELSYEGRGEPQILVDVYAKLRLWDVPPSIKLQRCESIELLTVTNKGTRSRQVRSFLNDDVLLTTSEEPRAALTDVSEHLGLGLGPAEIQSVLDHIKEQENSEILAQVRNARTVEEKLAALIGEELMRRQVPGAALSAVTGELGRDPNGSELARLVLAVHGVEALEKFKNVISDRGLTPPTQWAGGTSTRRFVADLGFPVEFAGFASDSKPAMFGVDGPADLDPLHDYQTIVTSKVKAMLRGTAEARGMVSLPTGAGKTRVAVQALVEEIAEGNLGGPIIWIAQSDELCEQAIETWSFIWRSLGPSKPLHVGRLWSTNDVDEVGTGIQLIVATPQKLLTCKSKEGYAWLTENSVVIVDEAHTSVAPMYTEVLEWLGLGRSRKDKRPLIGLTATPFRNTNIAETSQLAARYDKNRLDEGAFVGDPYEYLQKKKVLATVEQEVLEGVDIQLSASELAETEKFKDIPRSVQLKLGSNVARNQTILESVASLPEDWTVLLFATSVDNARVLASLLTFRGIPAVAISGETDMAARRHYIEEFKAGRIRVITNYNVLAQGFDAPAVRAVYVTRPTFSANLYQQMIGRGLRGPLNGGSEKVKIVNVEDNVVQYGADLAFTEFEHLWKKDTESDE